MLSPLPVKGAAENPVFKELNRQSHEPTWNFNKYLVKPDGKVTQYFDGEITPDAANTIVDALQRARNADDAGDASTCRKAVAEARAVLAK